jgi:hypothetical protein
MGRMLMQQTAKQQAPIVEQQLSAVTQSVNAEMASYAAAKQALSDAHDATIQPLFTQQRLLHERFAFLQQQANETDLVDPRNPNHPYEGQ